MLVLYIYVFIVTAAMGRHDMVSLLLKVCVCMCDMHIYLCIIHIFVYSCCRYGQA
jgi:hypothetical protein